VPVIAKPHTPLLINAKQGLPPSTLVWIIALSLSGCALFESIPSSHPADDLPSVRREFRAAWVATIANIDWPSAPGLPVETQQREATAILDTAALLNLNALILQVRPQCDAFYPSAIEPWSYYLSGQQGQAPEPYYDPLAWWVQAAHARGLELHVWFNPFRAHHPQGGDIGPSSVVKQRPHLVKELAGGYYWLNPAQQDVQDYSFNVVMDVLQRYDVDGIHFDDYFYPYPAYNDQRDFPDDDTWAAYQRQGGKLARADWRRDHISRFIQRVYKAIKEHKQYVKFGISPFGIWRPGHPESIHGLDQYNVLYADTRLWLQKGWLDYLAPQLYWPVNQIGQSFPVLLSWWSRQNLQGRNLWPGLNSNRAQNHGGVAEQLSQIMISRGVSHNRAGHIHFSMKSLVQNFGGITDSLIAGPYKDPALVPRSPWLDAKAPPPPHLRTVLHGDKLILNWDHAEPADVFRWIVYLKRDGQWNYEILNHADRTYTVPLFTLAANDSAESGGIEIISLPVTHVAVSAVDRLGNESDRLQRPILEEPVEPLH